MEKASGKYENHSLSEYKIYFTYLSLCYAVKKNPYRNGEVVNLSVQKNKAQKYDQSTESIGSRTFWVYNCVSIVKLWFLNLQLDVWIQNLQYDNSCHIVNFVCTPMYIFLNQDWQVMLCKSFACSEVLGWWLHLWL